MSIAPESLKEVRRYLVEQTGKPPENFSIRAAKSARGFHAGKSEIYGPNGQGDRDYSVKHPRNKAGLTEASSAIDIKLPINRYLKPLTAYLVAGGKDGSLDIFEVIGPDATGKANYWGFLSNWEPRPKWAPASHEWHIHLGIWRDTEFSDRVAIFRPFFEPAVPPAAQPVVETVDAPDPEVLIEDLETQVSDLLTKIAAAKVALG